MATSTTWTTHIDASPQAVFETLADLENHSQWSDKTYKATKTSDGPAGVGSTFDSWGWLPGKKENLNHVTVTAYEPGRRFAFDAVDPSGPVVPTDFLLADEDGGTSVTRTSTIPKPGGFQGFIWPVLFPALVKPAFQKNLDMFKAVMESKGGETPSA
jgi:uncharacterized protein YndB with AHSA1/START domain